MISTSLVAYNTYPNQMFPAEKEEKGSGEEVGDRLWTYMDGTVRRSPRRTFTCCRKELFLVLDPEPCSCCRIVLILSSSARWPASLS